MRRIMILLAFTILGSLQLLFAQGIKVTGTVTDANTGELLPGVNIVITNTTSGTISSYDGTYSIEVPGDNAELTFSFLGYVTQNISVSGKTVINVALKPDVKALEEVVVIGYGTLRKEAVTGSVESMAGDAIRDVPSSDVTQALQGRIAGVEMSQTSTKPGSSMQIRIRGTRSLTASNDPLIVLDGIPFAGEMTDIDPNDIKSIDILKDASATAIYGSRGANGVILISTNKGYKGEEAQVSLNSYYGSKQVNKYPMMNASEFVDLREYANMFGYGTDEDTTVDYDYQDLFYRPSMVTNHDLKVAGGTEKGSYYFGVGYYLDQSPVPSQQFTRYSVRASIDQEIGKYFHFGLTSNNNYSLTEGDQIGLYNVLSRTPIVEPYNDDGSWKRAVNMAGIDDAYLITRDIIDELGDSWISEKKGYGTYNNIFGEIKIPGIEGLKYRANVGLNLRMETSGSFTGKGVNSSDPLNASTATITNKFTTNWVIENLLSYDKTFAGKHQVNLVGLYSAEETQYNKSHVEARDIPNPEFQYYNLGQALGEITVDPGENSQGVPYQDYQRSGLLSYMGRAMYTFDSRYMIMAAVRSDGSSRLTEGQKWHTYPAVSAGWNIGNESFMKSLAIFDMLKIRVGYGQTSNQSVDPYATLGLLDPRPYNFGSTFATGYFVKELPTIIGWEYSITYNFGLDFSILNGRLSGTIEHYITNTEDLLMSVNLPPTSGAESVVQNVGTTENIGNEISLNGTILEDFNGLTWDVGFNLYSNKNTLTALASGMEEDEENWWFVGHPINVIYDYENIGIWQEDEVDEMDLYESGGNAGMIKVKYYGEYNPDGTPVRKIGTDDRIPIHVDPDFQGGFSTRLSYKGLDLGIVGAYKKGGVLISTLYTASGYLNMLSGRRNNVKVDYWTPENTDAKYPKPGGVTMSDNPKYGSTLGYFDASYLKIRTITLGYNFDKIKWIKDAGISKLRFYVTAQNPLVLFSPFHSETGLDPETNSYGNENAAVPGAYKKRLLTLGTNTPSTRNFLFGINVTF